MSGVLIMNSEVRAAIAQAIRLARARPTPWVPELVDDNQEAVVSTLKDRPAGIDELRQLYPSQHVRIGTYDTALSFEFQPAGLFRHLSVSAQRRGKVPGLEVMQMLVAEFGFSGWPLIRPGRIWVEEFARKHHAVNVVELEAN